MTNFRAILRGLARTPAFTAVAILSLALGIGANTAMFSLLDQVLLRMLPVNNPRQIVFLYHPGPAQGRVSNDDIPGSVFSYPMFRDLQKMQTPFVGIAGSRGASASISYRNNASDASALTVSGNYFDVLGVTPAMGRVFNENDDGTPSANPLVVLSYDYWVSRFGADPGALNQTIQVNGYPMTIIGVVQQGFSSERPGVAPNIFVPLSMKKEMEPGWDAFDNRRSYWLTMFARLKPGVSIEQATAAINVSYRAELDQDVALLKQPSPTLLTQFRTKKMELKPGEFGRGNLRDESRQPVLLLMGMTAMVLLISCANVANLQLGRAAARAREIAVRLAIGASRGQLIRHLLSEALLLSIAGGALGLLIASWTMRGIIAAIPQGDGYAGVLSPHLDTMALLFCAAVSVATGLLFGIFPALKSTRPDLAPSLKDQSGQSTASGSAKRFRMTLVTAQIALSLLLLVSAGLFGETLLNLRHIDLGIRADHLLTFSISPRQNRYSDQATHQFYDQFTERLAAVPGVKLVSAAQLAAIAGDGASKTITVTGYIAPNDDAADSSYNIIGADYFRTMGIPLIAGREFTPADGPTAPKVAVVNQEFVKHFLAGRNPLGEKFATGSGNAGNIEIVGVVKNAKYADMKTAPPPEYYTPYRQEPAEALNFYLRTAIEPARIGSAIRSAAASLDSNLPIRGMKTLEDQIDENLFDERMLSTLTVIFAALATLLAALGLYGVLAYNVARRTREIGIRMALGAEAGHVRGIVFREVAAMLTVGTIVGLGSAIAAGKIVQQMLYGMRYWDPSIFALAAGILWAIALAAAYVPLRKAQHIDPLIALRYE